MRHLKIGLGLLLLTLVIATGASAQVLISKIQTSGASATDEFIELYNNSSSSAPLAGLALKKQTASGNTQFLVSSFPASAVINSFSYFLIAHTNYQPAGGVTADFNYTNSSNSLADNNAALLLGAGGEILDSVFWGTITSTAGSPAPNPEKSQTLTRLPNDATGNGTDTDNSSADFIITASAPFNSQSPAQSVISAPAEQTATTTPTTTNSAAEQSGTSTPANNEAAPDYSVLKINEIMPNPESGNEWAEIYNSGSVEINLTEIAICDATSATSSCKIASGTIAGSGFAQIDLGTARYLNNDGDSVRLFGPNYELLDAVSYSGDLTPESGQALARKTDGLDTDVLNDWAVSTVPTPGRPNIIVAPAAPAPKATNHSGGVLTPGVTVSATTLTTKDRATTTPKIIIPDPVRLTLKIILPANAAPNELITFSAKGSADPRGGIISYRWNFGDNATADNATAEHAFATSGLYTVTLSATSTAGTVGHSAKTITIAPEFYTASGTIIFSEILANPLGEESTDEFIELQNTSSSSVSIAGWHLVLGKNSFTIPAGSAIAANSFAIFYRAVSRLALTNTNEQTITLTNAAGTVKDALRLPTAEDEGESYARFSDVWQWSNTPTPGLPNALVAGEKIIAPVVEASQKNITAKTSRASRARANKTAVVFRGTVTAPPGIYGKRLVYVANADGGLLVQVPPKWSAPLPLGAAINVSGLLTETAAGKIYLKAKNIIIENQAARPMAAAATTGEELPDAPRGALISFTGDITELKKNYAIIDDTEGEIRAVFKTGAHITKTRLTPGLRVTIAGVLEENNGGRELWPRGDEDIQILSAAPAAPKAAPSSPAVTYGATTAGGAALVTIARRLRRAKFVAKIFKKELA